MARIEQPGAGAPGDGRRALTGTAVTPQPRELVTKYKALGGTPEADEQRALIVSQLPRSQSGVATSEAFYAFAEMAQPDLGQGYSPRAVEAADTATLAGMLARVTDGLEAPAAPQAMQDVDAALALIGAEAAAPEPVLGQAMSVDDMDATLEAVVHELELRILAQIGTEDDSASAAFSHLPEAVRAKIYAAYPDLHNLLVEQAPMGAHRGTVDPMTQFGVDEDLEAAADRWLRAAGDPDQD